MKMDNLLDSIADDVARSIAGEASLGLVLTGGIPTAQMPLEASYVRDLTAEDVLIGESTTLGSVTPNLKRLRDSHHTIARLMAMGKKNVEISAITGYSQSRLSILKNDPAFRELLEFYRENTAAEYIDVHKRVAALALDATAELHDRLLETPEQISTPALLEIVKATHDRTGLSPVTRTQNQNLNINMTAQELAEMKAAAAQEHCGHVQRISDVALPTGFGTVVGNESDGGDPGAE